MKKLFLALVLFAGLGTAASAQTQTGGAKATTTASKVQRPVVAKSTSATPVKADGTPDMRFKQNKNAKTVKPAGPVKADGTPDMRYKTNQAKPKAKAGTPGTK